jgi:hypothetical protein
MAYDNLIQFKNKKLQKNPFTEELQLYGITGDVAGIIIQKLNSGNFNEFSGKRNSELNNIYNINEYTDAELLVLKQENTNIIKRAGDTFYISGNLTNDPNKEKVYSKFNIRIIKLYIHKQLIKYLDNQISKNIDNDKLIKDLEFEINKIVEPVKKYLTDFAFEIDVKSKEKKLEIKLFESYNQPITKIIFNVGEQV